MKRTFIIIGAFVLLAGIPKARAQSTLNATGGTNTVGAWEYDWSIGEMALVSTVDSSGLIITQGLLQNDLMINVKVADVNLSEHLQVFPNPATSVVNVQYIATGDGQLGFRLMDMTGKTIMNHTQDVKQGITTEQLNISQLAAATYMLEVNFTDNTTAVAHTTYKIEKLK
jgi:type IX secretion system substrate protein